MLSICAYEATRIGFTAISRSASKATEFVCQRETTVVPVPVLECVRYTYVIDRATQKLIGRRVKKPDANDEFCGLATNDLTLSFVRGSNIVQALQKEAATEYGRTLSRHSVCPPHAGVGLEGDPQGITK